jgi:lycopene beta-cyclase
MDAVLASYYDFAFIGMGCGNALMLMQLEEEGLLKGKKILVIEPHEKEKNDRTFCFWMNPTEMDSGFLAPMVSHAWSSVTVGNGKQALDSMKYYRIPGAVLNVRAQELLNREQVNYVSTGYSCDARTDGEHGIISIGNQEIKVQTVFDNRPPSYFAPGRHEARLYQSFYGWQVKCPNPVFDPSCFTMMDFEVEQEDATQFMYVLPLSEHHALVEITRFGEHLMSADKADAQLRSYMLKRGIQYEIEDKEQGAIPMFIGKTVEQGTGQLWINTGERAGKLKPSTGYSFERSLTHAKNTVQSLKRAIPMEKSASKRFSYYDRLLLQILRDRPEQGRIIFTRLFAKNSAKQVFDFLDERTKLSDDLKIFSSLPIGTFVTAAFKDLGWRVLALLKVSSPFLLASVLALLFNLLDLMPVAYAIIGLWLLILGIPHGALDHLHVLEKPSGRNIAVYASVYLFLGLAIYGLFHWSSWLGLLVFLLYSVWHFGQTDVAHWRVKTKGISLLWGSYFLGGLLLSHWSETRQVLAEMQVELPVNFMDERMVWAWIIGGGLMFLLLTRNRAMAASILALIVLAAVPLIPAFAIFFVFQHSLYGWITLKNVLAKPSFKLWFKALPFTLGAILLFAVVGIFAPFTWGQVFVFLAALSFPHVVLMSRLYNSRRRSSIG